MRFYEDEQIESKWKNKNKTYIFEVEKLLDLVDNIENKRLKEQIIYQYITCDKLITKLAEETMKTIKTNNDNVK